MDLQKNKNSIISGTATVLIMVILIVVCALMGLYPPDPPIPEEGVEVNLGNSDFGLGDNMVPEESSEQYVAPTQPSAAENVSTQTVEQTVSLNANRNADAKVTPKKPAEVVPEAPKEPQINSNALFKKREKTNTNGGSQGVTQGSGNQGKQGGDPNSNRYDGQPGQGGVGFSLAGRSSVALPHPSYDSNKEGKIVVKIWVDRDGNVTRAEAPERGSTISNTAMVNQAKQAALKAKFSKSESAAEVQTGTITYTFVAR